MEISILPKVLIIGLGKIGLEYDLNQENNKKIITHSLSFFNSKYFDLIGGVDKSKLSREQFKKKYKLEAFSSIEKAVKKTNPDIVVISTSTQSHLLNIKETFNHGKPKVIICEKPLSYKLQEAIEIINLCEINMARLYVNYFRRVDPGFLKILDSIKNKKFSTPFQGICLYSKGLFNTASHFVNILELFFGEVKSFNIINKNKRQFDPCPDFNLNFSDGDVLFLSNKNNSIFLNNIDLIMANGKLSFENGGRQISWKPMIEDKAFAGYKVLETKNKIIKNNFDKIQFNFVEQINLSMKNKKTTLCTGKQALQTQKVLNQINNKL